MAQNKPTAHKATRSGSRQKSSAASTSVARKKASQAKSTQAQPPVDVRYVSEEQHKGIPDIVKLLLCMVTFGGLLFGYTGASLEQWVHDSQADEVKTDVKR
jgi:hypothetical protein